MRKNILKVADFLFLIWLRITSKFRFDCIGTSNPFPYQK